MVPFGKLQACMLGAHMRVHLPLMRSPWRYNYRTCTAAHCMDSSSGKRLHAPLRWHANGHAPMQADSYLRDKFLAARTRNRTTCGCSGEGCVRTLNCLRFCIVCTASLFQVLVRAASRSPPCAPISHNWATLCSCHAYTCMHTACLSMEHRPDLATLNTRLFVRTSVLQTPWVLCLGEVLAVLLLYLLGTSRPLIIHEQPATYHFSYMHSLEDVVGLCCTRSALLSISYAVGMHHMHRCDECLIAW